MEKQALPVGQSAADKQEEIKRKLLAESVAYTRSRAEKTAMRLLKARARRGDFAVPEGATALDLIDLLDELAKNPDALHIRIKPRDLDCLRTWNATRRLMLQVREEPDAVEEPDKAVGLVLA
jgi:hypothetical protein